jgi:hypothetical protein
MPSMLKKFSRASIVSRVLIDGHSLTYCILLTTSVTLNKTNRTKLKISSAEALDSVVERNKSRKTSIIEDKVGEGKSCQMKK